MNLVKKIVSKLGAVHFERWSVLETSLFRIYLHKISKADEDRHRHSHPWNFISFVLRGFYVESIGDRLVARLPLSFAYRSRHAFHKIEYVSIPTWTLVFAFGKRSDWGYQVGSEIISNKEYRKMKGEIV